MAQWHIYYVYWFSEPNAQKMSQNYKYNLRLVIKHMLSVIFFSLELCEINQVQWWKDKICNSINTGSLDATSKLENTNIQRFKFTVEGLKLLLVLFCLLQQLLSIILLQILRKVHLNIISFVPPPPTRIYRIWRKIFAYLIHNKKNTMNRIIELFSSLVNIFYFKVESILCS